MSINLTTFGEEEKVVPAIHAGTQGHLLKDITPTELVQVMRAAYLDQVQLRPEELTERELNVLRLIGRGLNNREIADELIISDKTVKTRVSSILSKPHLGDRTQAAIYALRHGSAPGGA